MVTAVAKKQQEINFGHLLKSWCNIKEIELCFPCEFLVSKDTPQGQKTVASVGKPQLTCCKLTLLKMVS